MTTGYKHLKAIQAIDNGHIIGNAVKRKSVQTKECAFYGCSCNVSIYAGDGSETLCTEHQSTLREWGGFARLDRPYTLYKKNKCEQCGFDPFNYASYKYFRDDYKTVIAMRLLDVDHIVPPTNKTDKRLIHHLCNYPSNLRTLCKICHADKTTLSGDFLIKN